MFLFDLNLNDQIKIKYNKRQEQVEPKDHSLTDK
jgi:hypothetical protein